MPFHRKRRGGDISAIFVHAGAGYHSVQNERVHLQACADAAKAAMAFLKNGGTAIDAVEVAIKVLEDKEITNAGYGSNLAIDGTVECDATIVDQYGRSGAVGAVSQISNPIHLARLILEHSTRPLSLRRVPPNLLVGQGATDFAFECGMSVLPNEFLVSPAAKERWNRWKKDLQHAQRQEEGSQSSDRSSTLDLDEQGQQATSRTTYNRQLSGLRNESQPYSPQLTPTESSEAGSLEDIPIRQANSAGSISGVYMPSPLREGEPFYHELYTDSALSPNEWRNTVQTNQGNDGNFSHRPNSLYIDDNHVDDEDDNDVDDEVHSFTDAGLQWLVNVSQTAINSSGTGTGPDEIDIPLYPPESILPVPTQLDKVLPAANQSQSQEEDMITDTVGAIAVDCFGNIAAGSSSGGIGMKHRGRTGPAALVGIGTSVVPIEADDKTKTCVATVTSGTGEHMATTGAAGLCANRIYLNQRKGKNGTVVDTDEEGAIRGFVDKDFMGHPSVKNSHSAGAIGIMAVKKTVDGLWLHFAHNTDSFALASMHSEEDEPACVMSRGRGNNSITSGARSLRHIVKAPGASQSSLADEPRMKRQRMTRTPQV